jgi:hypothetical protein
MKLLVSVDRSDAEVDALMRLDMQAIRKIKEGK